MTGKLSKFQHQYKYFCKFEAGISMNTNILYIYELYLNYF